MKSEMNNINERKSKYNVEKKKVNETKLKFQK